MGVDAGGCIVREGRMGCRTKKTDGAIKKRGFPDRGASVAAHFLRLKPVSPRWSRPPAIFITHHARHERCGKKTYGGFQREACRYSGQVRRVLFRMAVADVDVPQALDRLDVSIYFGTGIAAS